MKKFYLCKLCLIVFFTLLSVQSLIASAGLFSDLSDDFLEMKTCLLISNGSMTEMLLMSGSLVAKKNGYVFGSVAKADSDHVELTVNSTRAKIVLYLKHLQTGPIAAFRLGQSKALLSCW